MRNAGLEEAQAGIKIAGRNINNFRYADGTTLMTESEEDLKSHFRKVKEENEKVGLKLNIQKTKNIQKKKDPFFGMLVPSLYGKWMGKQWKQCQTSFFGLQNYCRW